MRPIAVAYCISMLILIIFNTEAATYYFNVNKTNNEFMIYNRSNPYSASNPSRVYLSELRNNVTRRKYNVNVTTVLRTHPLLDEDWNYNWINITRSKLPTYIVKYYEAISKNMDGPIRILFNTMHENSSFIRFNLSQVNVNEKISDIELHFYYTVDEELLEKSLILRMYQVNSSLLNHNSSIVNPDAHKLLNVIYILQAENGWQIFKLTNSLYASLQEKVDVLLLITVSKPNDENFSIFNDRNLGVLRTFMTLEFESEKKYTHIQAKANSGNSCRRQDLYIDFEKLNWMRFIIAPNGYHAFNCYGRCMKDQNLPNHLKIISYKPETARKVLCCIPTDYTSLPIMFYDKNGNIIIKMYEDMIASNCGCR